MVEHVILFHLIWCMLQFSGRVPSLQEGNLMENIFIPPWKQHRPIVLGRPLSHTLPFYFYNTRMNRCILTCASLSHAFTFKYGVPLTIAWKRRTENKFFLFLAGPRFKDAFQDPISYLAVEPIFEVSCLSREVD